MSPTTFSATTTTPQDDEIRAPRPIVVAGIELPEEEMWRLWLRINKKDIKTPVDPGRCLVAVLKLGDFVRRYNFRFTVLGEEIDDPLGYLLVTQSKWFYEGYRGMPEEQIPLYQEGKCEERARVFLKKCKVRGAAELPFRTLLVGEDASLH
ncbi:hypothetical protein K466DRAFT_667658 [Polyporus arcularius HHB13444]|uniref:Uncharacterized protein n=1 Tax=Polyporus arcularius HHB13444 TaxID=1314778 RepID=A0A5C3P3X1_9APHY|nr:hypothetical protein K466DRAFT_667658 [Polyporus arcularius HHB13444]